MGTVDLSGELAFGIELAELADAFTLPRFEQADFTLGWKDDRTEVTEADRGAERLLADHVLADRPGHGFFGEEHGLQGDVDSPWRWIVDPIDGTSGFVRGIPVWATLIALTHAEHERRRRRRLGAGDGAAVVGVDRTGRVRRRQALPGIRRG